MDTKPINPLVKHFRRPAIHFKLPSGGRYWEENSLDLPVTGEIPVYPMTAGDEVTLKTPDALMNGSGVVTTIQSCCPNIRDAWKMPSIDVDAVLIAIRIASYGQAMSISAKCPHCDEEHDYDADLSIAISGIKCPDFDTPVDFEELKIKLQPQQYFNVTRSNLVNFEEQRMMTAIADANLTDDVRGARLKESMRKILELNDALLVSSTEYIETEDGVRVKDADHIMEFYKNAEAKVSKDIEARLGTIQQEAAIPPFKLKCTADNCGKAFEVPMEFDYARFFARGS